MAQADCYQNNNLYGPHNSFSYFNTIGGVSHFNPWNSTYHICLVSKKAILLQQKWFSRLRNNYRNTKAFSDLPIVLQLQNLQKWSDGYYFSF